MLGVPAGRVCGPSAPLADSLRPASSRRPLDLAEPGYLALGCLPPRVGPDSAWSVRLLDALASPAPVGLQALRLTPGLVVCYPDGAAPDQLLTTLDCLFPPAGDTPDVLWVPSACAGPPPREAGSSDSSDSASSAPVSPPDSDLGEC